MYSVRIHFEEGRTRDFSDSLCLHIDGLGQLARREGLPGLSKGMALALFGVSNGAIQFMTYEELKKWRIDVRKHMLGEDATDEKAKNLVGLSRSASVVQLIDTLPSLGLSLTSSTFLCLDLQNSSRSG